MEKKLEPKDHVSLIEFIVANTIEIKALSQLLVKKGILTFEEIIKN